VLCVGWVGGTSLEWLGWQSMWVQRQGVLRCKFHTAVICAACEFVDFDFHTFSFWKQWWVSVAGGNHLVFVQLHNFLT